MTDRDIISAVISYYDEVDPDDGDNLSRRARLLSFLQQVYDYVWNYHEWEWTYAESTVALVKNQNYAALPTDFMEFGKQGGLWTSDFVRMTEITRRRNERFRFETSGSTNTRIFSISGGKIQLGYTPTSNDTAHIYYRTVSDSSTFIDSAGAPVTPLVPAKYDNTVILPGLVYKAQVTKQDARPTWSAEFRDGLAQMSSIERPTKTGAERLPLSVRGAF